ncbi:MAG TPA: hypothetical protein VHM26_11700, partial [Chitinophagaceae bacterium]|nr:hypothetical protein [Chitinophagaceae bacterium]
DEKGRLNVIYASSGPTKYYYADSVVTEVTHFINGTITGINIYKLRPNGLVYMRQNGFQTTNTYSTFEYSASRGLLLQVDTFMLGVSSMRHIYYRTGNRIDSIKRIYQNVRNTHIFEYHTDRINTVTNESAGKSFLGISNANPIKRESVRNAYGTLTIVGDYTYEYDAQNRITKRIMTRTGFPTEEITYSYY